jgi:phytoene dehydrogenase-like protein
MPPTVRPEGFTAISPDERSAQATVPKHGPVTLSVVGTAQDAIVIGGGHNGLVCAAYLARAGLRTTVIEARDMPGGCASTVDALGARVNVCNCDHLSFRTTPVADELGLAGHGLRYIDVDPGQRSVGWGGETPWFHFHDVGRTLESLRLTHADEVDAYRRYVKAARPAAELVLELANHPPTVPRVLRTVVERRGEGARTLLAWSRRSVGEVMRSFFRSAALRAPAVVTGPAVWGLGPDTPRTGLGALGYAMRHVGHVGRPEGGSGSVPASLASAFTAAGGTVRCSTRATAILVDGDRVRGVAVAPSSRPGPGADGDGAEPEVIEAPVVVVACDPTDAFLRWLTDPPASMHGLLSRWRDRPHRDGYESKLDALVGELPVLRGGERAHGAELGVAEGWGPTTIVYPSLDGVAEAHRAMGEGRVHQRPMLFVNIPSVLDPTMRAGGDHVLSLEVLFTPYALRGGWPGSPEPERWLHLLGELVEPGFLDTVRRWRAMTPDRYERELFLRRGHAPSFAGGPLAALAGKDPELTRYETPVNGLFLTGAATFPGAGVWGASGRNTAAVVLRAAQSSAVSGGPTISAA